MATGGINLSVTSGVQQHNDTNCDDDKFCLMTEPFLTSNSNPTSKFPNECLESVDTTLLAKIHKQVPKVYNFLKFTGILLDLDNTGTTACCGLLTSILMKFWYIIMR